MVLELPISSPESFVLCRKPQPQSSDDEKSQWIRSKYEERGFLPPVPYADAPLQQQLVDAITRSDTRQLVLCLAKAQPDTLNEPYSRQDSRRAIHIAATLGHLPYLQLLLWVSDDSLLFIFFHPKDPPFLLPPLLSSPLFPPQYNADVTVTDAEGRNAYFYAIASVQPDCAHFLFRHGCPAEALHHNGTNNSHLRTQGGSTD